MECRQIDNSQTNPISDICIYGGLLVVASYDKLLRVYDGHVFVSEHSVSEIVFKMCTDGLYLLCGTVDGVLLVLNSKFNVIQSLRLDLDINILVFYQDRLVIGSWVGKLAVLRKNALDENNHEYPQSDGEGLYKISGDIKGEQCLVQPFRAYSLSFVRSSKLKVLQVACGYGLIAVALENVIEVYDDSFSLVYKNTVQGVINSLAIGDNCIYIGLLTGKVYFMDLKDPKNSYIFHAHVENKPDIKIHHSVNQLQLGVYLYSAGSNGQICYWDFEKRKLHSLIVDTGCNIRKFLLHDQYVYAILEEVPGRQNSAKVVFAHTITG